jgi:hypothetical protein
VSSENPYAPPRAAVVDVASPGPAPGLWNPNAAASWSLIFSPVFGAILHMKNWQAMGDERRAATSRKWAVASAAFFVVVMLVGIAWPENKALDGLSRLGGLILLLAWYYGIGKSQNALVLARYGKDYPRKGWAKPLGAALGLLIAFILAGVVVGFLVGSLAGTA